MDYTTSLPDNKQSTCSPLLLVVLTTTVLLSGCGTKYSRTTPSAPQIPTQASTNNNNTIQSPPTDPIIRPTTMTPPLEAVRSLPAAIALRDQAANAAAADNHPRALGLLERALRISPDDPLTFQAMAQNHLAMNQPGQALQLARRGLSLNPTHAQRESLMALVEKCQAML